MVICTAGDFYGTADIFNEPQSHFVARVMGDLGYDAVGVGEMDLNFGLGALVGDARAFHLPVVCANLMAKTDSLRVRNGGPADRTADRLGTAFPPYVIVKRGEIRVGFLGVISPSTKAIRGIGQSAAQAAGTVESLTYSITDPAAAVRDVGPELRAACDVMVVLAHMSEEEAKTIAAVTPGIDFIVLGHDPKGLPLGEPVMAGATRILRATAQGQYIGDMSITLGPDRRVVDARNRLHWLEASLPDDPEMAARLDRFDEDNRKVQKDLYARQQMAGADGAPASNRYLGVGTCQSCHLEAFEVYTQTAHARAFETLSSQFVHRDSNCVGCHVTGYGDTGGFSGVRSRGAMLDLVDVQCEACHGPGSEHTRDGTYAQRAVESCVKCHTENDDPDFDFDRDWPKIAH